jgi:cytochrome c peroxidase
LCPGAPRLEFLLGRPKATAASPPGLIPEPQDSISTILARFAEVNFSPAEVGCIIVLLGNRLARRSGRGLAGLVSFPYILFGLSFF